MKEFLEKIIQQAGEKAMEFFAHPEVLYTKDSAHDVVTQADGAAEAVMIEAIKKAYPDHGIISEEAGSYQENAEYVWYLDPVDGTKNFSTRVPLFGVLAGLAHHREVILGAIYLPVTKELCIAEKGKGAYLNGRKIQCSSADNWEASYGIGPVRFSSEKNIEFLRKLGTVSNGKAWISGIACVAVSSLYVADGRRDWYISRGGKDWDYAAPSIILKEAGCVLTNGEGEPWAIGDKEFIVSNKHLHPTLLKLIV